MKFKKIFLFFFIALLIILFSALIIWNIDPICNQAGKQLTYDEVLELNNLSNSIQNIYVSKENFEQYRKDNIIKQNYFKEDSNELELIIWREFSGEDIKEVEVHMEKNEENIKGMFIINKINGSISVNPSKFELPDSLEKYEYNFLGRTKYEDKNVFVIKLKYINGNFFSPKMLFYIDEDTGIVLKVVQKEFPFKTYEIETKYKIDSVTDDDIKEPSYANYSNLYYIDNTASE